MDPILSNSIIAVPIPKHSISHSATWRNEYVYIGGMNRKPKTINFWVGRLPHWEVQGGRYFITLHVAGAIPQTGKNQIRAAAEQQRKIGTQHAPDWLKLQRRIFAEMEKWLDRTPNNPWLQELSLAEMVAEAIETRRRRGRWNPFSYIIMPNHLHLFAEIPDGELKAVLEDFKRWTGHQAMKLLDDPPARFWQKEWFDHWSRSDQQDDRILKYIQNNPIKAGLPDRYRQWPYFFTQG
ncbi:MAG: hypothetical protein NXI32_30940 [bacterium]|nr:hypothetical protein [bacterium]